MDQPRPSPAHQHGGTGPGNLSGVWQSPELRQDKTSAFSFNEVGEFPYFCEIHGLSMTGTVTVVESGGKISVGSASAEETPTSGLPGYYED